jgi:uncharacterized membrane protein
MDMRKLAKDTFKVKGNSALVILSAAFSFIAGAAAVYNLAQSIANPLYWVLLVFSASVYLFSTSLLVADFANINEYYHNETNSYKD